MTIIKANGRLCNQIFRNICVSIIAQKFDLYIKYSSHKEIELLGIKLYVGNKNYSQTIKLNDKNYFDVLLRKTLHSNLNPNRAFFQTKQISNFIYKYLQLEKNNIIQSNPFKQRYHNNDCFIHIRLTDAEQWNPGLNYYLNTLKTINFDNLYIGSDNLSHDFVKEIVKLYPKTVLIDYDPIKTIQFGSTCKYLILSHGSFSAIIGYLGFYSTVFYKEYDKIWFGDMFSIPGWIKK